MSLKKVHAPHLSRHVKLGRRSQPKKLHARLLARDFLKLVALPTPPTTFSFANASARPSLSNIFGNDELGDCVVAAEYHAEGVATANAGAIFVPSKAQIVADYSAISGYVVGDESTDQGCNEIDALDYWKTKGLANGTKILGHLIVDATNKAEICAILWLFESIMFGVSLPDRWISPFPSADGFVWDSSSPDDQNGHAFEGVGVTTNGVVIETWGLIGTITWAAIAKLAINSAGGELHVALTPDMIMKGQAKAPNGFAWGDLIAAWNSIGGNVPAPVAPPVPPPLPPPPGPAPTSAVTLAQAQSWGTASLEHQRGPLILKTHAEKMVHDSLAAHWPKS